MFREHEIKSSALNWTLPFNLAVLSHVIILASAIIIPKYIDKKPIPLEFLTVDLISIAAPLPPTIPQNTPPAQAQVQSKVTIQKLKPVEIQKKAPIAPIEVTDSPVTSVKAISIKPLKRKVKKKLSKTTSTQRKKLASQKVLKRRQEQLLIDARRQQELADAESIAARDAVKALKQMLRNETAVSSTNSGNQTVSPRDSGNSSTIVEKQYQSSIGGKLMQHWALPDIKTWNPELSARIIITIAKNGYIVSHNFEKRSGDRVFDQFVSRTIQESNPLLPIPGAMRVSQYSIGLVFMPGQIQ